MKDYGPGWNHLRDLLKGKVGIPGGEGLEDWPGEEWESLLSHASRHGLGPLLYHRLRERDLTPLLPGDIHRRLRENFFRSAAQSVLHAHHLSEILGELRSAGVPVIVLKGSYLAEHVYEDGALRPMCDIDLMVSVKDLPRAATSLERTGWAPSRTFHIEAECSVIHHLPLFTREGGPGVELHWDLTRPGSPFSQDLDGIWQRSVPATWGGEEALAMAPEDLVIYLAIHAAYQHRFAFGLRPLCDIREVLALSGDHIDWGEVEERAGLWTAGRCLALTLLLAGEMVGAEFPSSLPAALAGGEIEPLLMEAARDQVHTAEEIIPGLSSNLARLWGKGSLAGKVSLLRESFFPSRRFLSTVYPVSPGSPGILLFYPRRWKDLLARYGSSGLKLLSGNAGEKAAAAKEERGNVLQDWLGGKEHG